MDILEELSALRRADAEEAAKTVPYEALVKRIETLPAPHDFCAAFAGPGIHIISELKKASPSEGLIRAKFDPVAIARAYAANGAAAMSVLCEPHKFLGGEAYLKAVRQTVETPLLDKDFLDRTIATCVHEVMDVFYRPELGLIVEHLGTDGQLVDCMDGRQLNPGHAIEAMWFIMDLGKRLGRQDLIEKAVQIALNEVEYGWDKEFGGIFYFMDRKGYPLQQLEWDQKLW